MPSASVADEAAARADETKASPQPERGPADQDLDEQQPPRKKQRQQTQSPGPALQNTQDRRRRDEHRAKEAEDEDELEEGEMTSSPSAAESSPEKVSNLESEAPPLPVGEEPPPLPSEPPPDDGWDALWDDGHQAYYFYNRVTGVTQWENPRVPEAAADGNGTEQQNPHAPAPAAAPPARPHGGYNPAIHGDYDPNADYAVAARAETEQANASVAVGGVPNAWGAPGADEYAATGAFNRFTGKWQGADQSVERHNDENKSKRQMNAFFDVDAAANSHGGRSLKAERQSKKLSKAELKAFKDKRREKKEEKRRAWLRD